jgi:hypothetical protein
MARRTSRILPYEGNRDHHYYLDGLKVNGKRMRLFKTLTVREIEGWLHGLDLSPQTVNNFRFLAGAYRSRAETRT